MPKHAIRIPALRAGRRVRWMFEVFADVGEDRVRTPKTSKKPARAKRTKKVSRVRTARRKSLIAAAVLSPSKLLSTAMQPDAGVRPAPATGDAQMAPQASKATNREVFVAAAIGVVAVVGAALLVAYPSAPVAPPARTASVPENAQRERLTRPVHVEAPVRDAVAPAYAARSVAPKPKQTPVATTRNSAPDSGLSWRAATTAAAGSAGPEPVAPERNAAAAVVAPGDANRAVTINGCLEMTVDEDQFRLTDTDGAGAPKARSWKSGFLKKGSAAVELVEFSDAPTLRTYVGHRVAATGVLTGRQLRVRSVQASGSSCD